METTAKIIVVSAPSGAGKTTIIKSVLKEYKQIVFSISATTRAKREGETDGVDYFFLTVDEFETKIAAGEFVEWEKFYDNYYGTLRSFIDSTLSSGNSVLLEIDVKGAQKIIENYPDCVSVFISPPSIEELKQRLLNRHTESETDLKKRFDRFELEFSYKDKYEYIVINDEINNAVQLFTNILRKEKVII